jgi:hypothetical protein
MRVASVLFLACAALAAQQRGPSAESRKLLQERHREGTLNPGQLAPDFTLKRLHSEKTLRLSSFRGVKPVALVFGSYT